MKTTRTPKEHCLSCGKPLSAASDMDGRHRPSSGDISICVHCGAAAIFNADLTLRPPTQEEATEIAAHPEIRRMRSAIATLNRNVGGP